VLPPAKVKDPDEKEKEAKYAKLKESDSDLKSKYGCCEETMCRPGDQNCAQNCNADHQKPNSGEQPSKPPHAKKIPKYGTKGLLKRKKG
jgi:hypothetical protein